MHKTVEEYFVAKEKWLKIMSWFSPVLATNEPDYMSLQRVRELSVSTQLPSPFLEDGWRIGSIAELLSLR
jgi:hypothetical protein